MIMGSIDKVKVAVRVRPFNRRGTYVAWCPSSDSSQTINCHMAFSPPSLIRSTLLLGEVGWI